MAVPVGHDIDGYLIGKGIVSFKRDGISPSVYTDMGNAPTFELTPNITKLDHYSSRVGTRTKDKSVVTERAMQLRLVLDVWSAENLALALLGEVDNMVSPAGGKEIEIFSLNSIEGAIRCVGTNDVGPKWTYELYRVSFIPDKALSPISDEWGQIELTADVLLDPVTGKFGRAYCAG